MFSIFYPAVHYVSRKFIIPYIRPDVQSVIRPVGHANKQPAKPYFAGGPFYGTGWRRCGSGWRYALGYKRLNKAVSLSREPIPVSPDVPLRMGRRLTGTARTADCPSCPRNILCSGHSKELCDGTFYGRGACPFSGIVRAGWTVLESRVRKSAGIRRRVSCDKIRSWNDGICRTTDCIQRSIPQNRRKLQSNREGTTHAFLTEKSSCVTL